MTTSMTKAERRAKEFAKPKCTITSCNQRAKQGFEHCGHHLQEQDDQYGLAIQQSNITALIGLVKDIPTRLALEGMYNLINERINQ